MILIPIQWLLFDNKCIFTYISAYLGEYEDQELDTDASFTESNFKWLFNPILEFFGMEWETKNVNKILTLYALINIILVWFYAFYFSQEIPMKDNISE